MALYDLHFVDIVTLYIYNIDNIDFEVAIFIFTLLLYTTSSCILSNI